MWSPVSHTITVNIIGWVQVGVKCFFVLSWDSPQCEANSEVRCSLDLATFTVASKLGAGLLWIGGYP